MSEEQSGSSGLKNAIIGLITIIVTAIAGVIGKKMMGGDEAPAAVAPAAPAPIILNLNNTNTVQGGGSSGAKDTTKKEKKEGKDDWAKKPPKW